MNAAASVITSPGGDPSPASTGATGTAFSTKTHVNGGRFDFDDGGTYCGGWEDGKAHGHGVCTGPKGQGAYSGSWNYGFEVSGVYIWPSGSAYEGQWQNGKRHGLGVESRGRWIYRGEWTQGFKGRYGVRQSSTSNAKYEGTWANGLQDGYGSETYADGGTFQGQWMRGMRHGYGVRASAPFGLASHYKPTKNLRASMTSLRSNEKGESGMVSGAEAANERDRRVDDSRGGFVLRARSDDVPQRRRSLVEKSSNIKKSILSGLKIKKQRSTGDLEKRGHSGGSMRSTASSTSWVSTESSHSGSQGNVAGSVNDESNASFVVEDEHMDANVTETYMGEWKNDKRAGFGISERSDGLKYEGEWFGNKKYGYGITTFKDGTKEEGKYKNNVLITSQKKKHLFLMRSAKFRERIDAAVNAAQRAYKIALQKADIAISRMATARGKAELADLGSDHAREDYEIAKITAKQFAPDFSQPGLSVFSMERPKAMDKLKPRDYARQPTQGLAPGPSLDQLSTTTSALTHTKLPSTELPSPSNPTEQLPMPSQIGNRLPMPGQPRPAQQPIQPQSKYSTQQPYSMGHGGQSSRSQTPTHMYQQTPPVAPKNPNYGTSSVQKPNPYPQSQHQTHSPNQNQSFDQNQYYQPNQIPSQNYSQNQNPNLNYNQNQNPSQNYSQNQNPNLNQNQIPNQSYSQNSNYPQQQNYPSQNNPQSLQSQNYPSQNHPQTQNYPDAQSSLPNHIPYNQNPSFPPQNQSQQSQYPPSQYSDQHSQYSSSPHHQAFSQPPSYNPQLFPNQQNQPQSAFTRQSTFQKQSSFDAVYDQQLQSGSNVMPHSSRQSIRRGSNIKPPPNQEGGSSFNQAMSDHFDHYKRPPSRDSSVDRYTRAASRLSGGLSRQPSVDRNNPPPEATSPLRGNTPIPTGNGSAIGAGANPSLTKVPSSSSQSPPAPFEDLILRKRTIGQDIVPSPIGQPKRTESLYLSPPVRKTVQPKEWFSRQQLVMLVLFVNLSLAIMFFKLLT
uniref:Junctophilin-3 n=1 Tax=Cacopsylla melanoneura TaxID=428564 RepID=A0A8D8RNB0_9HEMI